MWIGAIAQWLEERRRGLAQGLALAFTVVFYAAAYPPFGVPEGAFVFAVPMLLWLRMKPSLKAVAWTSLAAGWIVWLVLLIWLRHVTWAGTLMLSGVVGAHFMLWALGAAWLTRRLGDPKDPWAGLALAVFVAAWWVAVEWLRGWIFSGFPWLPLAASQWERPIMLQSAAVFGSGALSFALVLLNAGLAGYALRIVKLAKDRRDKSICPEFYVALVVFTALTFLMARDFSGQDREPLFKAAALQPAVPQNQKWDGSFSKEILKQLDDGSRMLGASKPDILFWPEAVMPFPLKGDEVMEAWLGRLANEIGSPIMAGANAIENPDTDEWRNGVFLAQPNYGVYPKYYAKRHLVPFGEFIPFRRFWPWIKTFVPLDGDFQPGREAITLPVTAKGRTVEVGPLICFEDVFPELARETVLNGAAVLFVASNSAWYGRSAASAQHMAHSVLRAVENRRVVIRCGNDGWTGWIDEYGRVRAELVDEKGEIWFKGGAVWEIDRDRAWKGKLTPYTKNGDWFAYSCVGLSGLFLLWAWRRERKA